MANKIANRKVICDTLLEAAETDKDIVVLCSDSRGSASLTPFFDQYPQQSVEVGIAEQDRQKIFEPFVQMVTHATTSGTGLGLAIARGVARAHGGDIRIDSEPGRGTTFTLTLAMGA